MDLNAGDSLSHYTLLRRVGSGGMAAVWAARDRNTDSEVALKLLHSGSEIDVARVRMLREAHATRRIQHPAIVPVHDVFDYGGRPILVMELLRGETLRSLLHRQGCLPLGRAAKTLLPIAEALLQAHEAGIVHRDLKPENIFVQDRSDSVLEVRVRLLDFGVARSQQLGVETGQTPITALGSIVGTLAYMAPEQALRPSESEPGVDVWAFGVTLYETLSGCRPIEGETPPDTMRQLLVGGITPLHVLLPDVSAEIGLLVSRMLTRQPERRLPGLSGAISILRRYADPA